MKNKKVCEFELCSGCGACIKICPQKCIDLIENKIGALVAEINENRCINCNLCHTVCHINVKKDYVFPKKVFAAWSCNEITHSEAASGGIASEIMKYAINNDYFIMGTRFYREKGVVFEVVKSLDDIIWAKDSKYVYSNMQNCFEQYANKLSKNIKSVFIGLPCQVSALKCYLNLKKISFENIIFVDIICHGVPPFKFLVEHLKFIEKKKEYITKVRFRNPGNVFLLQCYTAEGTLIYKRGMHEDDAYYRSFALNLNFRDNCYACQYAREERISDFTIGDYSGLGQLWPYKGSKNQVSVILTNSDKGRFFLDKLYCDNQIELIERPLAEPFSAVGNPQLRHPSIPFKTRNLFIDEYLKNEDYERAANKALRWVLVKYQLEKPFLQILNFVRKILPQKLKLVLKKIWGK